MRTAFLYPRRAALRETAVDQVSLAPRLPQLSALLPGGSTPEVLRRIVCRQFRTLMLNIPPNVLAAGIGAALWLMVVTTFKRDGFVLRLPCSVAA